MQNRSAAAYGIKWRNEFVALLVLIVLLLCNLTSANAAGQLPGKQVTRAQNVQGVYWVQLYAVSQAPAGEATGVLSSFDKEKIYVHKGENGLYRVMLGPYATYTQGQQAQLVARQRGIAGAFIRFTQGAGFESSTKESFWLQIYSLRNKPDLQRLNRKFAPKQIKVALLKSGLHQVFVGPFSTREQAKLFKRSQNGINDAFLAAYKDTPSPAYIPVGRRAFLSGRGESFSAEPQLPLDQSEYIPKVEGGSDTHLFVVGDVSSSTQVSSALDDQYFGFSGLYFNDGVRKVMEYGHHREYRLDWGSVKGEMLKRRSILSTTYRLDLTEEQLYWDDEWIFAGNLIYDHRRYAKQKRLGVGVLAQSENIDLYAYSFKGLSDWQPSSWQEEQNAKVNGLDLGVKGRLPEVPALELGVRTYKLFGQSQQQDVGYAFSALYNPVPALFFRVEHDSLESEEVFSQAEVEFLYRFGVPLKEQF